MKPRLLHFQLQPFSFFLVVYYKFATGETIRMSSLTIAEAAELLNGKASLATLHRHTKSGVLSYSSNAQGNKIVDIAELERVYGPLNNGHPDSHEKPEQEEMREVENTEVVEVLREQVALLKSQLETANREKESVLRILENQTLMLPKPKKDRFSWLRYFRLRK